MKAGITNSLSARCAGACPFARKEVRRKKRRVAGAGRSVRLFPQKRGRKKRKEGKFRKKVHKFSFILSLCSKNEAFFSRKIRPFETKFLLLRLIKHNFPFIPPHCGVHIAQSRGTFPDPPAQTLSDLLNHRDFALSLPIETAPKDALPPNRETFARQQHAPPWGLYGKKEEQKPVFLPQEKGHSLSLDNALWATPFVSCPAPGRRIRASLFYFRGACFLKKKARSPIQKGFEVDFFAVLKFTGQQLFTKTISASASCKLRTKQTTSHRKRKTPLPLKVGSGV